MKTLLRSLFISIVLICSIITFLLTPMGLRFTVDSISPFLPGKLSIKKISGVIVGPLTLDQVHYQNAQQIVNIKKLTLNWDPIDLFKKQFHINTLKIDTLYFSDKNNIPKNWDPTSIQQLISEIKKQTLPLNITIDKATVLNSEFFDAKTQTQFRIKQLSLHTLLTQKRWDTEFSALIEKPKPFQIHFQLTGKPINYTVNFAITGDKTDWKLIGTGDQNTITLHTPSKLFLSGSLDAALNIDWKNAFQWKGKLTAKKINFSMLDPQWIRYLSFNINSAGNNSNHFNTENDLDIKTSNADLQLVIAHKNTWHIEWHLAIHTLKAWLDKTQGNLVSHGEINGNLADPHFNMDLKGRLHDAEKIRKITLNLTGDFNHHVLLADMSIHRNAIHLEIDGHVNKDNQWLGKLQQLSIGINRKITWQLEKTAALFASNNQIHLDTICLRSGKAGDLCLQGEWTKEKIVGSAKMNVQHFEWLQDWVHNVRIPTGQLVAELKVNGTLKKPNITGNINLNNGSVNFPRLNVTLNKLSASITGDGKKLNFDARAYSQQNPLNLKGYVDFTQAGLPTLATLTTDNAVIVNTPEYKATITSNLTAKIQSRNIAITGDITIPSATITPNDFQSTTTLPIDDVVYVGESAPSAPFWSVNTNINVNIGNDVNIKEANISAKLGGSLHLIQAPNQSDLFASGEIAIEKGTFDLYGQTLTLSPDSYLSYTNNLLNNPNLDVSASKEIQSVENMGISNFSESKLQVGILLRGSAKSPKITFFSNRARLSQADILSYLLLGYANTSNTPGNTDFLLRALSAVKISSQGLLGKQNIATQIQSGLGLNEMGVESDTTTDALGNPLNRQSAFVVGKNLTRKIYVRTSIGLLDPVNVYELRYLLDNHWTTQINSSSLGVGADVLYTTTRK
ncbi:MAG: translocation/assembly module TamB domain-containing protein [Gammaproteobacteria bacterium]|nr:translocation/assembly module TamB domain-containing protein [Gammaproteobacteria bacterium]